MCVLINQYSVLQKESGSVVLSIDALFGLPGKKAAGQSVREPIHGHLFFGDQTSVDEFVSAATYAKQSKSTQVFCVYITNLEYNFMVIFHISETTIFTLWLNSLAVNLRREIAFAHHSDIMH